MMFAKYYTTICGPGDNIVAPPNHSKLDYEVELVIVVGKRASRRITSYNVCYTKLLRWQAKWILIFGK